MKKLFLKILFLIVIVGLINIVIKKIYYDKKIPYYWGDADLLAKRNELLKTRDSVNTLFIGSSKTFHQIDVKLFDSIVNAQKHLNIHSFNFGINGMLPPESFKIYKNLLSENLAVKNIFLELNFLESFGYKNLHQYRTYYWLDKDTYGLTVNARLVSKIPLPITLWNLVVLNMNWVENNYNIGKYNNYVQYKKKTYDTTANTYIKTAGFEPMISKAKFSNSVLKEIKEVNDATDKAFRKKNEYYNSKINQPYITYISDLLAMANKKNIKVYFIVPVQPKLYQYQEIFPLIPLISKTNPVFDMANLKQYPELFKLENLYDDTHLNFKGAKMYTQILAKNFLNSN